jgi:hypothetical protein
MSRLPFFLFAVLVAACAGPESHPASLMEGSGDTRGVRGLERLEGGLSYQAGALERFRLHVDPAVVQRASFSASAGALTASGFVAEWTLPQASLAELTVTVVRRDGTEAEVTWQFAIQSDVASSRPGSAQAALLAMPMPVLDGGSLEVSGGACDLKYEGTTNNVALAFTTATHPALMYGRWNGSTWALEVVDAMGFNTGGVVSQYVQMQVEANGTPHLVYVRNGQAMYATKSGGTWLRERIDTASLGITSSSPLLTLGAGGAPTVVYGASVAGACGSFACVRPVVAVRTSPGSWTRTVVTPPPPAPANDHYLANEALFDGSRLIFPMSSFSNGTRQYLVAWTPTVTGTFAFDSADEAPIDGFIVSPARALYRTASGLHDLTLNATFSSTTRAFSSVEQNASSSTGDIVWAQTRPVLLHLHGSALELVSPNAAGFWTYTQLGNASSSSASLAVHPTSGDVSLCYQANGRIMFQ